MAKRVLIVEDERSVADAVAYALKQEGFKVEVAGDGRAALDRFIEATPDLVILDLMLPGMSGWDLLAAFRRRGQVPVIVLSARAEEPDRVAGLETGADDYVTKPFSMRELTARVRSVLRRSASGETRAAASPLEVGGVCLDPERREVIAHGEPLELSPKEFELLAYLMRNAGRVRTREQILNSVWGEDSYIDQRTVDVHVRWLRAKIERDPARPEMLLTVRGVGYKFMEDG